jgi:hypothetical protein
MQESMVAHKIGLLMWYGIVVLRFVLNLLPFPLYTGLWVVVEIVAATLLWLTM